MDFSKIPTNLNVTLYGKMEPVTPTLSKCRVRIFYKYMNRNRTFISDNFANQLISSLPYTPVKGIFDKEEVDFQDHGEDNTDGRIYGIVPAEPNFAWEDHQDEDGVTRSYACADVLLFTGLYPEAKIIPNESQSMEIFKGNLTGEWKISNEDGDPYYHFNSGCLVGLQVLGQAVEPCFEGASFFSQISPEAINEILDYVRQFSKREENKEMETKTLFRLSDNEKANAIQTLANPNFNEEGGWKQERLVLDVYDDYALCVNLDTMGYERIYYTKDGDNVTTGDIVGVSIVDVTAGEYAALEALKSAGGGSFENANTTYTETTEKVTSLEAEKAEFESKVNDLETEKAEFESKVSELETKVNEAETASAEFTSQKEKFEAEKAEMEKQLSDIQSENESLTAYKKAVETEKKEAILTKYEEYLTETAVTNFKSNMENYSVEDFKKEVCTAAVESDSTIFSKRNEPNMFYKGGTDAEVRSYESPAARLINKYKNGGNK